MYLRNAKSCLTDIMGRMACESGKQITLDEALASTVELAPGLEELKWDSLPPARPDPSGNYEVAMPGQTRAC
jgi:myo-inositol 2-dehydrogenase/D-chiro-inositol 1-dehydrogenase